METIFVPLLNESFTKKMTVNALKISGGIMELIVELIDNLLDNFFVDRKIELEENGDDF